MMIESIYTKCSEALAGNGLRLKKVGDFEAQTSF